jgi:light-regulated signal transduction histidine kinase (bacteriophytochrome)
MTAAQRPADLAEAVARGQREVDAYLALASHDLKEPLRGIHHYAQLVARSAKERLTPEETARLGRVIALTRQMDRLIEDLLTYSRAAHAGRLRLETSTMQACRDAVGRLENLAAARKTDVRLPAEMPVLRTDAAALEEIFFHLISNALHYNDKDDRWVRIGAEEDAGPVFFVEDNGIGIAGEDQEEIFKLFRRLHRREEFGAGSGVGLALARRLVEQIGGRLWVTSAVGEGSRFSFTIGDESA